MTTSPKISIIVPVYNMTAYLRECLDAIVGQTFHDWECLLVNDGSTDDSGAICDEYAERDPRFKVIHRENGGVSAARNSGLKASSGQHIAFIDPDDVPHTRLMERLLALIEEFDADVAEVSYESFFSTFRSQKQLVETTTVLNRGEMALELLYSRKVPSYMWNKLFRHEIVDTPFLEGIVFEDVMVMSKWLRNIRKIVISPEILYSYRQRKGSIVHTHSVQNRMQHLQAMFSLTESLHELEPTVVTEKIANKTKWKSIIRSAKYIARFEKDAKVRHEGVGKIRKIANEIPLPDIKVGTKLWLRSRLLCNCPKLFIALMRLTTKFDFHKHYRARHEFTPGQKGQHITGESPKA